MADDEEPSLFDLPLAPPEPGERPRSVVAPRPAAVRRDPGELPLFPDDEAAQGRPGGDLRAEPEARPEWRPQGDPLAAAVEDFALPEPVAARPAAEPDDEPAEPRAAAPPRPAAVLARAGAALFDGLFLGAAAALAVLGAALMGAFPDLDTLPALGGFVLVFSFAYAVIPLAFWGRTPGMAIAGLVARGADGGPLTFGQTGLRWLGGLLTLALAGLPLLLAWRPLGGRSLADRLSGSLTWSLPPAG